MSGFRRHLMARIATRAVQHYISGTSTLYNSSFTFQLRLLDNVPRTYTAYTDANGKWRVDFGNGDKILNLETTFSSKTYLTSIDIHVDCSQCTLIDYAFTFSSNLVTIDMSFKPPKGLTNIMNTFRSCTHLEKIKGIENFGYGTLTAVSGCFRDCFSLKYDVDNPFDLSNLQIPAISAEFMIGAQGSAANTWYSNTGHRAFWQLTGVKLPTFQDGCNAANIFVNNYGITDVISCGDIGAITNGLSFAQANNLSLASAIVILSALQDLDGNTATLTFATSTRNLIQADTEARNLVAQAQVYGWTITGF